jgi:hypothetical protein
VVRSSRVIVLFPTREKVSLDAGTVKSDVSGQAAIKSDINFSLDFDFQ